MHTITAVVVDLWWFVLDEFHRLLTPRRAIATPSSSVERAIQVRPANSLVPSASSPITTTPGKNPAELTVAVSEAPLFNSPVASFDGVITLLPFGESLSYHQRQNRWLEVETDEYRGWILADNVTEEHVMPQFLSGVYYSAEHEVTKKVRAFIQNEFHGAELLAPLQEVEYVSYRLRRNHKEIPWTKTRPRTPGAWQRLLRGQPGVHIGISPKTDSIMEVIDEHEVGRLAYVDAVFPNQSILISEVGYPETGYFAGQTIAAEDWRELKPIFIDIQ